MVQWAVGPYRVMAEDQRIAYVILLHDFTVEGEEEEAASEHDAYANPFIKPLKES
jgi:hypothetical protein